MHQKVIFGMPQWHPDNRARYAGRLVAGLVSAGHDAHILLTGSEQAGRPGTGSPFLPSCDLPWETLPAGPRDTWGQRWEALERYLEERAPCHFLVFPGSTANRIVPRLSDRIGVVGILPPDETPDDQEIEGLSPYWNAIVTLDEARHFQLLSRLPHLATRTVTLSPLDSAPTDSQKDHGISGFVSLLERISAATQRRAYVRPRGGVFAGVSSGNRPAVVPPVGESDFGYLNSMVPWPPPPAPNHLRRHSVAAPAAKLEDHRVIVATTPGAISGVDVFSAHLVRGLRECGIDARLFGRSPDGEENRSDIPADLPFEVRDPDIDTDYLGWPNRWRKMIAQLEQLGPCVYLPNYDADCSCVAPQLSDRVRVVGIGHSDDPWHYEHLCRIGHACDAIVGVSCAITQHLGTIAPHFASRLETIPYGIPLERGAANRLAGRVREPGSPLRIIYTGRLVQPQKRALDLVEIARALESRGVHSELVIVGEGDVRLAMEREVPDLVRRRRVWFTGMQPNSGVLELLDTADVFLLPSAFEGLSVSMLEAMSRGVVPVVSEIRSGVPDVIVPNQTGLVARVGDIKTFADHLERLWRAPEERDHLAASAAAAVHSRFGLDQMIDRYVELFRRIIADPTTRSPGRLVPPQYLRPELTWSLWASRVAADPLASVRRVIRRFSPGANG